MSRADALIVQEADARRAVYNQLDRLETEVNRLRIAVANHSPNSTISLHARADAITDAMRIWDATLTAMDRVLGVRQTA